MKETVEQLRRRIVIAEQVATLATKTIEDCHQALTDLELELQGQGQLMPGGEEPAGGGDAESEIEVRPGEARKARRVLYEAGG